MFRSLCAAAALAALPAAALAADPVRGKNLHDDNCISCHASIMGDDGTEIYTRPDRRIGSLEALRAQVTRCETSLGVAWPEDDIEDVVAYLNARFYKFEE